MPRTSGSPAPKPLERVMIFIDGGYLRKLFNDLFGDDNINFLKLRSHLLDLYNRTPINPFKANLIRVYYYDGIVDKKEEEYEKHRAYFDSLKTHYFFLTVSARARHSDGNRCLDDGLSEPL